nr:PilZ domain-containing protein [Bacteriovoracaceae bacterium]
EEDKRKFKRSPFVARLFFHNTENLYEGICRDISVGGMQLLVANFPGTVGDEITLNVHPENTEYHFIAKGKIVRMLEGHTGFSLRFTEIGQVAKACIEKYIEENESYAG